MKRPTRTSAGYPAPRRYPDQRRAIPELGIDPAFLRREIITTAYISFIYCQTRAARIFSLRRVIDTRPRRPGGGVRALTRLAGALAGHRHAHLLPAWTADLYGDPKTRALPPGRQRMRLARGFVVAALRCRLDDAADMAWRPVDGLLSSWHGSNLAVFMPVTVAVGLVLSREGFYGLINDADNLGVIAAAPYAAIKGLRKYRQISTPKRPEWKASSARASADSATPTASWRRARQPGKPHGTLDRMPERKHKLPSSYQRLDGQITGAVADAIAISPRSHGRLHLPGEYSTDRRPPAHKVKITSTDPDNTSVYPEERLLGDPERYRVSYDVWNYRDSPTTARIVLDEASMPAPPS